MHRIILTLTFILISSAHLDAAVYKGQKTYKKQCRVCHTGGQNMAVKFTQKQWEKYFHKKGAKIASLHIDSQRVADQIESMHRKGKGKKLTVQKVNAYFDGTSRSKYRFPKMQRHLLDFFKEYAKDSNSVPACN